MGVSYLILLFVPFLSLIVNNPFLSSIAVVNKVPKALKGIEVTRARREHMQLR